jgi:hypothetical protein
MTTLLDLQNRIATDLARSDLTSQIANAVFDAIKFYERQRFWFNQTRTLTFNTTPGQQAYTASDLAQIPLLVRVDAMFLPQNQSIYPLDRFEPPDFEVISGGMSGGGRPTAFTYIDQSILLWPVPIAIYTLRLHAHYKLAPLVNPTDANSWTTDAEELIRSHAKLTLYLDVLGDTDSAQLMQAKIQPLKDALDYETSARIANGTLIGTDF